MTTAGKNATADKRRVAVQIDQEEAEALLTILMNAAEHPRASSVVTDRLLCLFADAQRALHRAEVAGHGAMSERFSVSEPAATAV